MRNELLGHRFDFRFRRLAVAHAFDAVGNTLVAIALAGTLFFAIPTDEARARVLLYLLFTVAPFAIVSAFLGQYLDRGVAFRRLAVVVAGIGRLIICWVMASHTASLLLFPLALGVLVGQRLYAITRAALVPTVLPPEEPLVTANSFLSRTAAITGVVTAIVGASLERLFGAGAVLRVAAVAYLLMGLAGLLLPRPPRIGGRGTPRQPDAVVDVDSERAALLVPGFRAIAALRGLSGFLLFLLAFHLSAQGAGAGAYGTVLLGIGLGALVSSVAAPFLNKHISEDLLIFSCYLGSGLSAILVARSFSTVTAAMLAGAVGVGFGVSKLAFDSMAQRGLPRTIQGRKFARWETTFQLCWVGGAAVPVAVMLPIGPALVLSGLATCVGATIYGVDTSRVRRELRVRRAASAA